MAHRFGLVGRRPTLQGIAMPPDDRDTDYDREYEADDGPSANEKSMGLLAHLLGVFTSFVGPAVLLLTHGDKSPFVARHAREALNCQVTQIFYVLLGLLVAALFGVAAGLLTGTASVGVIVAFVVYVLLAVVYYAFEVVCVIKACVAANRGLEYRYPLTVRLF